MGADFPKLLSVLQNFLVLLKMWSSLDLDFYSILPLLPDEFCGVWTFRILYYFMRESPVPGLAFSAIEYLPLSS